MTVNITKMWRNYFVSSELKVFIIIPDRDSYEFFKNWWEVKKDVVAYLGYDVYGVIGKALLAPVMQHLTQY